MRRLSASPLFRNVVAVASGAAAGQAVTFAFSPLVTRIYSPEAYGLQGVLVSLVSILSPIIALRYPMAIVVAKHEEDARRLVPLSLIIAFGLSCLIGVILLAAQRQVLTLLGVEALGPLIWFLPLALFCVALQDVMDYRAARAGVFRLVGVASVVIALLAGTVRVLVGLIAPLALTLIAVVSVAPAVQAAIQWLGLRRRDEGPRPALSRHKARALLRQYHDFPFYRMPNDFLNAASQSIPIIMLAALFSPAVAGLYTLTRSVLNLPSNIIGNAIGNVIYARFAELHREGRALAPLLARVTGALMLLCPVIVGLAWFAPTVFALVFGEEWREAGYYARWMSLWIGVSIANVPAVRVIPVIGRQGMFLVFNIVFLIARIVSVLAIYSISGTALMAVASFSVISAAMNLITILLFGWFVRRFDQGQDGSSA